MIEYGTPKLKRNTNIDEMIKPGTTWRLGDGQTHNARNLGRAGLRRQESSPGDIHSLARPDEKKNWTLLLSTTPKPDPAAVVVETPLHFMKENTPVDLKITLEKAGNSASLPDCLGDLPATRKLQSVLRPFGPIATPETLRPLKADHILVQKSLNFLDHITPVGLLQEESYPPLVRDQVGDSTIAPEKASANSTDC